jgi:histidinol phosphatase-like enzyme
MAHPLLADLAGRHGATPFDVALAWLLDLDPLIVPLPGVTRVETARGLGGAHQIHFTDEDRRRLDEAFPAGRRLRGQGGGPPAAARQAGEVVLVMGLPGAGKSTIARGFVERGYARLNRDEAGGRLAGLLPRLDGLLRAGQTRVVLDNTYVSRKARAEVLERAWAHGVSVRCVWARTRLVDAQINAVERMVRRYGRLLEPEELQRDDDPGAFGPGVPFRYERQLEPPQPDEGFDAIETVPFTRRRDASYDGRAVMLWADGVLYRSRRGLRRPVRADDVELLPGRRETLLRHHAEGRRLLGLAWRPEIAEGAASREDVLAAFARVGELLEREIEILYCPHAAGPPRCWCRKPLPGLAVLLVERHRLDARACVFVGEGAGDRRFAERLGFGYREAAAFFGPA